jgi:hypothetical protein
MPRRPRVRLCRLIELLEEHYNAIYAIWLDTMNAEHEEKLARICDKMMALITSLKSLEEEEECLIE